ncbi:MAG: hypothetical protein IK078_02995, partial [Lachnospiraceae bacterium]|nr:hypothetical protein [Lachnospiraceae bacterium]
DISRINSLRDEEVEVLKKDVEASFASSRKLFENEAEEDKEFLQHFAFICMLCVDVYTKKLLIEKLVDQMREDAAVKSKDSAANQAKEHK